MVFLESVGLGKGREHSVDHHEVDVWLGQLKSNLHLRFKQVLSSRSELIETLAWLFILMQPIMTAKSSMF